MQETDCMNYKKVGENIKRIRMQKGISQIELARAIDVSQTHMSNIENGNTGISLWTAVKIGRALACSIDSFADENKQLVPEQSEKKYLIDIDDLTDILKLIASHNRKP